MIGHALLGFRREVVQNDYVQSLAEDERVLAARLRQLERQGIVLREKNVGATVRFYSAEEVRQINEVREMLTRQAALMIALLVRPLARIVERCARRAWQYATDRAGVRQGLPSSLRR